MVSLPDKLQFSNDFPPISEQEWKAKIKKDLRDQPFATLLWDADDDLQLRPYYRHGDTPPNTQLPFQSKSNQWAIRQDIRLESIAHATKAIKAALQHDVSSLGFFHKEATLDNSGLALTKTSVWERLLETLDLRTLDLHLVAGSAALFVLDSFCEALPSPNTPLSGSLDANPLRDLLIGGRQKTHLPDDWKQLSTKMTEELLTEFRLLHLDTFMFQTGSPSELLARTLALACDSFDSLTNQGVAPARIAQNLHVSLPIGPSYFLEVAKIRACRILFAHFLAAYEVHQQPIFLRGIQSTPSTLLTTSYDDLLSATSIGAAAAIGGCDEIVLAPHDNSEHASRLIRDLHVILQAEAQLNRVVDPARGSYYVEALTAKLVTKSWSRFQEIERHGGLLHAIETGSLNL